MTTTFRRQLCRKRILIPLFCLLSISIGLISSSQAATPSSIHQTWEQELSKFVDSQGYVKYSAWKKNRRGLDAYIKSLEKISRVGYSKMTRKDKIALWINAYNAHTVKQILDHYPLKRSGINFYPSNSIRQIDGVWDKYMFSVAGQRVSLSDIENKILRNKFKEPRIHFAINCASKSCPPLSSNPYKGSTLEHQLDFAARRFISDPSRNKFDVARKKVMISSIFQWFKNDFARGKIDSSFSGRSKEESAVVKLLADYTKGNVHKMLLSNKFKLSYLPYDWSLNERKH